MGSIVPKTLSTFRCALLRYSCQFHVFSATCSYKRSFSWLWTFQHFQLKAFILFCRGRACRSTYKLSGGGDASFLVSPGPLVGMRGRGKREGLCLWPHRVSHLFSPGWAPELYIYPTSPPLGWWGWRPPPPAFLMLRGHPIASWSWGLLRPFNSPGSTIRLWNLAPCLRFPQPKLKVSFVLILSVLWTVKIPSWLTELPDGGMCCFGCIVSDF